MAAVEVTITGTLYDKLSRTTQQVVLIGEASLTGLGVGGGPIIPSPRPPSGGGPVDPGYSPPWAQLPVDPGYGFPIGGRPPSGPVDPGYSPPWAQVPPPNVEIPEPGSPPVILSGNHPSNPMVVPPAIVINYPGIGPVLVPKPVETEEEDDK